MNQDHTPTRRLNWRERQRRRRQDRYSDYDAFISYSRADLEFAVALQSGLERIAKPWNQMRSLKVFRDMSSLSPEAGLWSSIERGLGKSSWMILLMSPESARSRWVNRELEWWLKHRAADRILLILTEGSAHWDDASGSFDEARSLSIPPTLLTAFSEEPSWVTAPWSRSGAPDERLQEVVVDVASTIKQIPKDELFAASVREHRKTMRLARTGVISLGTLLVLVAAAGILALGQRNKARAQATLATSRQLAAVSESQVSSNLGVAFILAADAVRRDDNVQSRAALLRAALSSPHLVRFLDVGSRVTALSGSGDGAVVVAGLEDGRVLRWSTASARPAALLKLAKEIKSVAVSEDGDTVAASEGDGFGLIEHPRARLWTSGSSRALEVPAGQVPGSVAVSPSGKWVLVHGAPPVGGGAASISKVDGKTGEVLAVYPLEDTISGGVRLMLPSDDEAVLYDAGYGSYDHRDLDGWRSIVTGGVGFGTHEASGEPAANGDFITATNGAQEVPVWRTAGGGRPNQPPLTAEAPISGPGALALSPNGRRLAIADTGSIYVADVRPPGSDRPPPVRMTGVGRVDMVRFLGDSKHLVSVSDSRLALWDTTALDRLTTSMRVPVGSACSACSGAHISVSPDGTQVAVTSDGGASAALVDLRDRSAEAMPDASDFDATYADPVWAPSSTAVAVPVVPLAGGSVATPPADVPDLARSWRIGEGDQRPIASGRSVDGSEVIAVDGRGTIFLQSIGDGAVRRRIPGPSELSLGDVTLEGAVVADGQNLVATLLDGEVRVIDATTGNEIHRFRNPSATRLAFAGGRLFVQQEDGSLEVRSDRGTHLDLTIPGDRSLIWPPVPNPQGTLVARQRDNSEIVLVDVATGQTLATIPPNADSVGRRVGVAFSPDGRRLLTVTDEIEYGTGALLVSRDLSTVSLLDSVCDAAGRGLTDTEWRLFAGIESPSHPACG